MTRFTIESSTQTKVKDIRELDFFTHDQEVYQKHKSGYVNDLFVNAYCLATGKMCLIEENLPAIPVAELVFKEGK